MNNIALHGLSEEFQNFYFMFMNKDINVVQISIEYKSLKLLLYYAEIYL